MRMARFSRFYVLALTIAITTEIVSSNEAFDRQSLVEEFDTWEEHVHQDPEPKPPLKLNGSMNLNLDGGKKATVKFIELVSMGELRAPTGALSVAQVRRSTFRICSILRRSAHAA